MFNYIISLMSKRKHHKNTYPFNEDFRKGYRNAWINNIKDYTP